MLLSLFLLWLFLAKVFAQEPTPNIKSNAISIDHIPVVVRDLKQIKKLLSETLHFKVKAGRPHEGIENCFVKFPNGTYLEFTMPLDSTPSIGKYYTRFLNQRQGGASLAISVQSAETVKEDLRAKNISFTDDSNLVWKTVDPAISGLFYIEYADKSWKDTPQNTTHPNGAFALKSVWMLSNNVKMDIRKYVKFGFTDKGKEMVLGIPSRRLAIGNSTLFLIDRKYGNQLTPGFRARDMTGIAGFTIMVSSLDALKNRLPKSSNVVFDKNRVVYFLNEYNLFLEFTE